MKTRVDCTGKPIKQKPVIKVNGKKLVKDTDYTLEYKKNVNVGVATMVVKGKGAFVGQRNFNFVIDKGSNPMKVSGKTATVAYSKLQSKNQTVTASEAFNVKRANDKATYEKIGGDSKIVVNKKSGQLTVKTGLAVGTYELIVRVRVPESKNFYGLTKDVTVKVKVE